MKLATLREGGRDGTLVVVRRDLSGWTRATGIAPTLQAALDDWSQTEPKLRKLADDLEKGLVAAEPWDVSRLHAPLPRAYEWVDGSAYINHIILVRKARNAEPPATLRTDPLVYQGGSSAMLAPTEDIRLADEAWGCDFESEVCVITDDLPQGTKADGAAKHIKLLMLANDVTLRNLIPDELAKGFGFFQSKPATAYSPVAITPDELGEDFRGGRVYLKLQTHLNDALVGDPEAGPEMHFSFLDLLQHLAKTRSYCAGTIVGSGTVSNEDRARGISCLAERRMIETIDHGKPSTPFLKHGDRVRIEMFGSDGKSLFGRIEQTVVPL